MGKAQPRTDYRLKPQSDWHAALGNRLKRERKARRLTLRFVAERVGVCEFTVRRHEAGEMMLRSDDLLRAASALGVSATELLTVEGFDGPAN